MNVYKSTFALATILLVAFFSSATFGEADGGSLNVEGTPAPQNSSCVQNCTDYFYTENKLNIVGIGPDGEITQMLQVDIPHGSKLAAIVESDGVVKQPTFDRQSSNLSVQPLKKCAGRCVSPDETIDLKTSHAFFPHDNTQVLVVVTSTFVGHDSGRIYTRKIAQYDLSKDVASKAYGYKESS